MYMSMSGKSDKNIDFSQLCGLLESLGFTERIVGGHHVFTIAGLERPVDLQPNGKHAKAYQVRQIRDILKARNVEVE